MKCITREGKERVISSDRLLLQPVAYDGISSTPFASASKKWVDDANWPNQLLKESCSLASQASAGFPPALYSSSVLHDNKQPQPLLGPLKRLFEGS